MDEKDLVLLEFPRIREIIASYCSFSISREIALKLIPVCDFAEVEKRLAESTEARWLLESEPSLSLSGIQDIVEATRAAERGKMLDPQTLNTIRVTIEVLRLLRDKISCHAEELPHLWTYAGNITAHKSLESAIGGAILPEGDMNPNASGKLFSIRNRQRACRSDLVDKLQSYIASDTGRRYIQEPIVTEREGRFVIAVKSEHRGEVKGIVHDVSNSGASIFIEPWQTIELGNAIKELQIEEQREIERILSELSAMVGDASESIVDGIKAAAAIDFSLAKARFSVRCRATEAKIFHLTNADFPSIHLEAARHPLIGDNAVPIDIDLGKDFSLLVITGPNTGGKTVCLKTIGLLCVMTQAGLPIPASPASRVPVFDGIYADIGDEQSIAQTLSTFGWHMSNISRILKAAHGNSLVVLDELGASTDPLEGSALARAILVFLLKKGFLAAVTTHYTDLKVFAHVTAGLENASFDFDAHTLSPTFHLTIGVPGGSNAIATAAHFGLPDEVIKQACDSLSQENKQMEELLIGLNSEKQHLADINKELEREKREYVEKNAALTAELKKLREEEKAIIRSARDAIVGELALLQKEINTASSELRRNISKASVNSAYESSKKIREKINQGHFAVHSQLELCGEEGEISVGDIVRIKQYDVEGTVTALKPESNQAEVSAGALRFRVACNELYRISGAQPKAVQPVKLHTDLNHVSLEIDLRGKRADEIEPLVDTYLSDAAIARLPWVRIIHGFGTGTVRSIVREMAGKHPLAKSFKSADQNEGGDGATIIYLK